MKRDADMVLHSPTSCGSMPTTETSKLRSGAARVLALAAQFVLRCPLFLRLQPIAHGGNAIHDSLSSHSRKGRPFAPRPPDLQSARGELQLLRQLRLAEEVCKMRRCLFHETPPIYCEKAWGITDVLGRAHLVRQVCKNHKPKVLRGNEESRYFSGFLRPIGLCWCQRGEIAEVK